MKRISKIYYSNENRREGCANRGIKPFRSGFLSRSKNRRGLSMPEAMVSLSIMSAFMTMCCSSMVQYQHVFGRVERSMTYTQQLQVGLDVMMKDIAESNLSTFTDNQNAPLVYPVDLSQTPVLFKIAAGANEHGDNFYTTSRIRLSVNSDRQLVRELIASDGSATAKTLATHVEKVILSSVTDEAENDLDNALSISLTSTTLVSQRDQALRDRASQSQSSDTNCDSVRTMGGQHGDLAACLENMMGGGSGNAQSSESTTDLYAHEKKSVTVERIVRLNN